eukprot:ANDGO_08436.mRNA.1 hypothetical protein
MNISSSNNNNNNNKKSKPGQNAPIGQIPRYHHGEKTFRTGYRLSVEEFPELKDLDYKNHDIEDSDGDGGIPDKVFQEALVTETLGDSWPRLQKVEVRQFRQIPLTMAAISMHRRCYEPYYNSNSGFPAPDGWEKWIDKWRTEVWQASGDMWRVYELWRKDPVIAEYIDAMQDAMQTSSENTETGETSFSSHSTDTTAHFSPKSRRYMLFGRSKAKQRRSFVDHSAHRSS